jgi:hypothetical protein
MARKNTKPSQEATQPPAGLPTVSPHGVGLEVLGPEDLIIPRLVLVQPTSQIDGVEAGKFYLNLTGDQFDEVQAVFLKVLKGRVYFAEDANERRPLCGSPDRIKPSPRYEHPVAPTCGECAYSLWRGKEPPVCHETYHLLGMMVESGLPFWWSVKSTAIAPTKRFLSAIALRARMGKNLFDAQVMMRSQLVAQPGKKYHIPVCTVSWLKDSSLYRELYEQYAHEEIERTFQAEEATQEDGGDRQGFDWEKGEAAK